MVMTKLSLWQVAPQLAVALLCGCSAMVAESTPTLSLPRQGDPRGDVHELLGPPRESVHYDPTPVGLLTDQAFATKAVELQQSQTPFSIQSPPAPVNHRNYRHFHITLLPVPTTLLGEERCGS